MKTEKVTMNEQEKATIDALVAKRQDYKKEQVELCFNIYECLCREEAFEEAQNYLRKIINICAEDNFDLDSAGTALNLLRSFA